MQEEALASQIIGREIEAARAFLGEESANGSALLPILHALQEEFGFVSPDLTAQIAEALNISRAEVRGVISFYHDFRSAPAGRKIVRLCRAEACQAMGSERLARHFEKTHGLRPGETTPDGALTLESVYCLGNCALGPAALVGEELAGRMNEARIDAIMRGGKS